MFSKIDIRSTIASLTLVAAVALAAAALAPTAGAEVVPPPPPSGGGMPPAPPTEDVAPPVEESPAPSESDAGGAPPVSVSEDDGEAGQAILLARLVGSKVVLTLRCSTDGQVKLGRSSKRFRCAGGKGKAALKLSPKQRRRARTRRGLRVKAVVRSGGSTVRVPLEIRGHSVRARATISSASPFWGNVAGQCVQGGYRGGLSRIEVHSRDGFGIASVGETVYWGATLFYWYNGTWNELWGGWRSHEVTGTLSYPMVEGFEVNRGIWTAIKVHAWTARTGFRAGWADFTNGGYYDTYSNGFYCKVN